ncbi:unnamed protein product [Acanthoscelides obtectus]|uniref:Uncharacterized protein n=1 Tax=Acanthoscelides obtectus TaxID=200917 RepID=A0A9P0QFV3_ACAOB|nr:unnamed protein product [Acanthoscelides obtectus]CAK1689179.1 hypothetical protein AOBTE_LOCUS37057 [Acanthoscelides obtectus]
MNYYCLQHHCLPENFHFTKASGIDDVHLLQNAQPDQNIPQHVRDYFSLSSKGKPLMKILDNERIYMK